MTFRVSRQKVASCWSELFSCVFTLRDLAQILPHVRVVLSANAHVSTVACATRTGRNDAARSRTACVTALASRRTVDEHRLRSRRRRRTRRRDSRRARVDAHAKRAPEEVTCPKRMCDRNPLLVHVGA